MAGGGHHEPSVFTHFLPGMVAGIVLGGITGTLFVTHIATSSLKFFWETTRVEQYRNTEPSCADISGLSVLADDAQEGGSLTSIAVGDEEPTLLTVASENLRFVPVANSSEMYLTAVASADQREAFPALSLYRIDYCRKTLVHVLGSAEDPANIVSMSPSGAWVIYATDTLKLMSTEGHWVMAFAEAGQVIDTTFSPSDAGGALRFADGTGVVWSLAEDGSSLVEDAFVTAHDLPAWTFQSPQEYSANIK